MIAAPPNSPYNRYKLDCLEETKMWLAMAGLKAGTPRRKVKRVLVAINEIDLLIADVQTEIAKGEVGLEP